MELLLIHHHHHSSLPLPLPLPCARRRRALCGRYYYPAKTHHCSSLPQPSLLLLHHSAKRLVKNCICFSWRWNEEQDDAVADKQSASFDDGVELFNAGEYYRCHDVFESLWNNAVEPQRCIIHGLLQCSVALYHLLNQNHRGAMVELGEGLCKLQRFKFKRGPFHDFEQEASALLEFIYNTQLEHAACADDICIAMDGSDQSYRLLGDFAAGKRLYGFYRKEDGGPLYMEFTSSTSSNLDLTAIPISLPLLTKLPELHASEDDLYRFEIGLD
ncbi:hypothetical protein O6H91_14G033300 [Diphasiastrum complanatum]|uniref:Uncharacterized protein n=2 Tax=Diphasiastrum complanatum TaxID=34168 RepID=A0ACC2BMX5_DIPCM|nr:hypothetical protein O6H91_14G033300 [Diphasiastrum complanatum]KAJ7531135.1 hypothetical protein O6H91_14G033300 [Diphasiastrum complanatum]